MSQPKDITIGSRIYKMTVEEGQGARLEKVAKIFNDKIDALRAQAPDMDRDQLLVLAAMTLSDDHLSLQTEHTQQTESIAAFNDTLAHRLETLCD